MAGTSVFKPEILGDNLVALNSAIRQSYSQAKKHLQDGITVIKDEFIGIYDRANSYFNIIAHPVNNFLKDLTQIDAEFMYELNKESIQFTAVAQTNIVPIEQAMKGKMEENY